MDTVPLKDLDSDCPYIEGNAATTEAFLLPTASLDRLDKLLACGYRHFGYYFFRPICRACSRCIPLRIAVRKYRTSASARRLLRRNSGLKTSFGPPEPSAETYKLYVQHLARFEKQGSESYEQYVRSFFYPTAGNVQLSVWDADRQVSVMHLDVTGTAMSLVYCYYDDRYKRESLGTFSIVTAIEKAAMMGLAYVYLGYLVPENRHMRYKARYRPSQVLTLSGWRDYIDCDGREVSPGLLDNGFPGRSFRQMHG